MSIYLRVDTNVMKDQSNLVRNDINNIKRHWEKISSLINGTRGYWEGEASDAHIRIYRDIEDDVNKIIQRLEENPVKLQIEAGVYEAAETAATAEGSSLPTDIF